MFDHNKFLSIKAMLFDVDGVFTNNEILVMESGDLVRTMNTRDGQAIKIALEQGFIIGIITKGVSKGVRNRFELLGITEIHDGVKDKMEAFRALVLKHQLKTEEILYMGDDIPDLIVFDHVGIACCPNDAANDILVKAEYVSHLKGGYGCVREIVERVLRAQGKWII